MIKYRHGDVHIVKIDSLPTGDRIEDAQTKDRILAYGEITGHRHWIEEHRNVTTMFKQGDDVFFEVGDPVTIDHQEHGKQKIGAGKYRSRIVREFDHFSKIVRRVAD